MLSRGNRVRGGLLSQGNYNTVNNNNTDVMGAPPLSPTAGLLLASFPDEEEQHKTIPLEVFEQIVSSLKAKHRAEKDSLTVELQVFKAVLEGMASKIRYLQEFKNDRELM